MQRMREGLEPGDLLPYQGRLQVLETGREAAESASRPPKRRSSHRNQPHKAQPPCLEVPRCRSHSRGEPKTARYAPLTTPRPPPAHPPPCRKRPDAGPCSPPIRPQTWQGKQSERPHPPLAARPSPSCTAQASPQRDSSPPSKHHKPPSPPSARAESGRPDNSQTPR